MALPTRARKIYHIFQNSLVLPSSETVYRTRDYFETSYRLITNTRTSTGLCHKEKELHPGIFERRVPSMHFLEASCSGYKKTAYSNTHVNTNLPYHILKGNALNSLYRNYMTMTSMRFCSSVNKNGDASPPQKKKLRKKGILQDKLKNSNSKVKLEEVTENIKTIPNILTLSRMVLAPVCGYLVLQEHFGIATGLFVVAGITDVLDGYIARSFPGQRSVLGTIIDPLADKLLVSVLTVTLTMVGLIPVPLTALILFRDVGLISGTAYLRYISVPPPKTLKRFFDITHPTLTIQPNFLGKANTVVQLLLLASSIAAPVFGYVDHLYLHYLWYITGIITFMSGISYFLAKDVTSVLKKK